MCEPNKLYMKFISPCRSGLAIIMLFWFSPDIFGQVTGIKNIPGDYTTITAAVTALNAAGVGAGGVTFNIAANYAETITATISLTATGTSDDPILFQKDPATTGANPVITAYTTGAGTPATSLQDGIWRLVGSDYVTIDGIDLNDNPSNTSNPSTMEYGYALYKASTSNGCQFVTIKHCTITLNSVNNVLGSAPMVDGSTGIIIMNALPAAAISAVIPVAGGTNSNNRFYSNTIQNCNTGIGMIGYTAPSPFTLADTNNDIGGMADSTGNTIINYGGAPGTTIAAAAIRTTAQYELNVSHNTVNNNNGGGANHPAILRGIYINLAASANASITYNNITLKSSGTTQAVAGIENASGSTPAGNTISISNNNITNCSYTTSTSGSFYGIFNNAANPAALTIYNNTIANNAFSATSTGTFHGIYNSGVASSVIINNNTLSGNFTSAPTTGNFYGIRNSGAATSLTINSNYFFSNSTSSATEVHYSIYNSGVVTGSINIDSNHIGDGIASAMTFNAANSGSQIFIYNSGGGAGAALSVSNNNFQGITYAIPGSGTNIYISNTAATLSQAINGNTFTNLNVNTTGNITFIANSVIVPAAGSQNVNNNAISGTFSKTGVGGSVTLFTSTVASITNSVINNNNNNFSNITVAGTTTILGWVNSDAGGSTKTIQNNTFSNWLAGTGTITVMSINLTGANNATTGNAINNIAGGGTVYGIITGSGNDKIYSNTINSLVSTGLTGAVSGIYVTSGTTKNIYQNTIYDLQGNNITTGSVRGILISGGTTVNAYQNTIYSLQANSLTTGILNGIWVSGGTTITIHRNKIYDLSSSSSAFTTVTGATGAVNGILVSGTTANLNTTIRNNLIGDLRTPSASYTDPVRGISLISTGLTSNINVYHNTIYLNAVSAGANFGTSGIYHVTSTTATTAALDLRNNIIINTSVPKGTGLTVVYRRSSATLTNYAAASNNNLFYAGVAATNRLLFFNGTNSEQFLSAYKTRVSPRDGQSVTEDMTGTSKFISTTGSSGSFLHIDSTRQSQAESGGTTITGISTDFDGQTRQGNTGYAGTGTAPDIGADEMNAAPFPVLSGTYNVGAGQTFTSLTNTGGLFASINSLGLSGNVLVNITSDLTEDGSNVLYQWIEQGIGNYSVTIKPDSSFVRTISGNVLAGMIRLSGAKRLLIDGSNGMAGNYLTFRNTNTTGTTGTAFTFINGATNNTIKYCNVEAYANALNGVILFSTSTVAGGNSNNTISNCNINATVNSNTGNTCIYSAGTVGKENSTNTISTNNIYNYRDRALDITSTGSQSWMINNNSCYNGSIAGSISYAPATTLHGIRILGGSGYTLSKNYIGGSAGLATGSSATYSSTGIISFHGILLTATSATPASAITGNTIANISVSAVPTSTSAANVFIGIETNGSGIRIGGSLAGDGNTIGSNTTNGSIAITTTTTATNLISTIKGINCQSTGGFITGNQVGSIDIKNIGAGPAPSTFWGIYINNATAPSPINNNIIGSAGTGAASNSIRVLSGSTSNSTLLTGIYATSTVTSSLQVSGNTIKNISHQSPTALGSFTGIGNAATGTAVVVLTNNTISGNTNNASAGIFYGIYNTNASPSSLTITNNTISDNTSTATGAGFLYGVLATGLSPAITMNNNIFSGNTTAALTTGKFVGFYNASNASSLTINSNTLYGNATTATSGIFYGIYNSGAVTAAININLNNIGTSTSSAITYNAANSGGQIFINNSAGAATTVLSISNNNFQNINYAVTGTGANTYISNTSPTLSQAINGNTFTNMNVNTAGAVIFIADNVIVPANGSQNVNNNSIVGGFSKAASGSVTLFSSTVTSSASSITNNNSNDFSNITVTGSTPIIGWINTDAGSSTKYIQNNIFSNWIGGTGTITALTVNIAGTTNATTGNLISNISSAGIITAISTATGNNNIYFNTIDTLSSTGSSIVTAMAVSGGTTQNIYKNKIFDISSNNTGSTTNGILVSGGTTINVHNNFIGNLRTPAANVADAIRGISVTSAIASSVINVYYNTIYLNASSTGTTFGTSGIYHTASATATTAVLNLRNNSITNTSTTKGAGITAAYRRSGTSLSNYAATSNNNLFYAGTPGASKLIFNDGTSSDQTLTAYKARVSTRDALSVTEDLTSKFLSTAGASPVFLHMNTAIASAVESGAANIAGFTDDFDGQIRAGNPGYTGSSSSPDMGADEIFGIETTPPTITYTPLSDTTTTNNRNFPEVIITDGTGVNTATGTKPRIYYKRFSDANAWLDNTSSSNGWKYTEATNSTSPFTFIINYSLLNGGATVTAGAIQYFIVAQDIATTANTAINSGIFSAAPAGVALTSTAFPIGGVINSYNIPFTGTYNVGAGEVFTSLTKANGLFAAINSAGLAGNTTFKITSDLSEDGTHALDQWTESGVGNYTVTIQPDAATLRTIAGNAAAGLIRLNGADRVTIDGRNSGSGSYFSFINTNTAGTTGTAFTFINGAANNTIRYTGAEAYADSNNGVILFGTSAIAGGNSNNLIDNCTINAAAGSNTAHVALYSAGTVGNENSANTISNNSIYGYRDRGLDISATGSTAWIISGNSLYNGHVTETINYPASSSLHGIRVLGGAGYSILNNYIGGSEILASGTNAIYSSTLGSISYKGILLATSDASPASEIKGNTIAAISISSVPTEINSNTFTGIETNGMEINIGGVANGEGNTIGSTEGNSSISITTSTTATANTSLITGINCNSTGGLVTGNYIAGIDISNVGSAPASSSFTGLSINSANAPSQVTNNIIGSKEVSNSIRVLSTSSSTTTSLSGISVGSAVNSNILLNGNIIQNLGQLSLTSSGSFVGISNGASSGVVTISNDTIQNILTAPNGNSGSTTYTGIYSNAASIISDNIINNISLISSGANAQIIAINVSGDFANTISGNIISNLSTTSTKTTSDVETGTPTASAILGILNSTTAAGQIINNNRLAGFNANSGAAVNVVVTGIGITSTGSGSIFNNKFGTFINLATGTGPAICHIKAVDGSFNVYNNTLRISNLTNTNSVKVYGIIHASSTSWNYFHNSVRVGGSSNGAALRSAAFLLTVNSSPVLKNNIFFNIRKGTGYHYAVSNLGTPPSNWLATSADFNDLYSINPNTVAEWGINVNKTFAQWQSLTGGDSHSISNAISFITSTYDLEPDSITNCNFNNAGTPITTPVLINSDINAAPRNTVNPDLGAYEFSYTGFSIIVNSSSPVCSGDSLSLTVNPGNALAPSFSWRNPANIIVSTDQNPTVALMAGQYKVTITDSTGCYVTDSTLVSINQRPTATITSQTSLCDSGLVYLNISVTGTGLISGILSNGDSFSGTAPLIVVPVFVTGTASYSISDLSDAGCTSIPEDIPDTVTVIVTNKGDWLGITSNWSNAVNWCEGIVPNSSTNVNIPAGTSIMPVISDSARCNNLTINTGDTLTITGAGILHIAGMLTNYGIYTDNGTTNFNGTSGQQTFSGITTFNNLSLNNTNGLLLPASVIIKNNLTISAGTLNTNNFNITVKGNWINNASTTALTAGAGTVTFSGATDQSIGGSFATTFNNLTTANTGSNVILSVNASITGNLSVSAGIFDLAGFTANRATSGGTLTVSNNATLKIGGTNTFPINYNTNTLIVASTVEYSGTNQTVANQSYGNLKLSSSGGAAIKTFPATTLTVVGNLSSTLGAGTSLSFTAAANIIVGGNVSIGASTTFNGGSYSHNIGGSWVNNGTFNGNTGTITFTGAGTSVSGSGTQNFNNLTIAASLVSFSAGSITLTGNLATTGSGSFNQVSGGTLTMTGSGATISGLGISLGNLTISGTVSTASILNLTGHLLVSGSFTASTGTITMSGVSKTITGAGAVTLGSLSVTGSVSSNADFSISSGLSVNGSLVATAGTVTFTGTSALSGTANLFNVTINGTSLRLSSNSILGIASTLTITAGVLNVTSSIPNTVNFNGTGAQDINAIAYGNLILSGGNTKTAAGNMATTHDITIGTGTSFNLSSYTYAMYGSWFNNGTFIPGTSTVELLGPATAYINGATTFNILTSNTSTSTTVLILLSNVSADIVNMTNGIIQTGAYTLTITNTRTGNGTIWGNIQRNHAFTTGIPYAFEGPDNTITFSSVSSVNSITVSATAGSFGDFPFGGSINRGYSILVPSGTYDATLRLHYTDDELNGNNESAMTLWNYNGSLWSSAGKAANSITSNYVEQSGLTNITNRWTLSDDANHVRWNGSISTDWHTAANWTAITGTPSTPPSATDIVDLGTEAFTYQPTISSSASARNIFFGSAQAVTLTLATGGSLTAGGNIEGVWSSNTIHTIQVNDQNLTLAGNMKLSDGTDGHAINLTIGTGTINIGESLIQSGGANITFSGAGTMYIHDDFEYISGTFGAGTGTVVYNGDDNQHVAHLTYNNFTINKTAGIATIEDTTNVLGNLLITAGQLDNTSLINIAGNVTIDSGATLHDNNMLHVGGNWTNNGNYIASGAHIKFNGTGTQTVSASTFNNIEINKPVGSSVIVAGNLILNGDFFIISGTFNLQTFDCSRSVLGGTLILSDSATFIIGANNPPLNFATYSLSGSSTTIFDGVDEQIIAAPGIDFGHIIFRNTGVKTLASPITIIGNLTIESGAVFNSDSSTITLKGNWVNNGTFTPSNGTVLCTGISKVISGNTTFNQLTVTGSYTLLSNTTFNTFLNITSIGSLSAGPTIITTMNGDLINSGTLYSLGTSIFTGNVVQTLSLINAVNTVALRVIFNGSVSPVLNSTSVPQFGYLTINNTGGVNPSVGWTILYSLIIGSGASFNGGSATHNILGALTNNGTITSSGTLNFIPSTAVPINLGSNFSSTGTVIFGGAGAITLSGTPTSLHDVVIVNTNNAGISPSSGWIITRNFSINSNANFNAGAHTYTVGGDLHNNGTLNRGTSTFIANGPAIQDIYSLSLFNNFTVNKTAGPITLSSAVAISGILNFISGNIQTDAYSIAISSTGSVTGGGQSTGWIDGNLQKNVATGTNITRTFEVGDHTNYTPVSVLFASVTTSGGLIAKTTASDHPQLAVSEIDRDQTVNRYFTISNTGIIFTTAAITFNWVAADVDAGAITSNFKVTGYNGSAWSLLTTVSPLPTSIQATGIVSFGDFSIGQLTIDTWTGASGTDWFTADNWTSGVPQLIKNATIPGSLTNYPILNTGTGSIKNITIQAGATLTITGATLQISGIISNSGAFNVSNGTVIMASDVSQTIPANAFTGNTIKNLTVNNIAGVTLGDTLSLTGILKVENGQFMTAEHLTLVSTATQTALIDGSGGGSIGGSVTMQRYLASGFGYKYFSSPFLAATVNEFSDDLDLGAAFPVFYRYDENMLSSGWANYTDMAGILHPGEGYAANYGSSTSPKTVDLTGVVNNNTVSFPTLYNHNGPYTQGFNLVGNPYPSPIDWDAASGWSRSNIDDAVYYFNAGGNQYTGTYSSYINGVSSDGTAGNVIAAMQGFFVHVSNGTYPVTATLSINNDARVNNLVPDFRRRSSLTLPLIRLSAGFKDQNALQDPVVVYFDDEEATPAFDKEMDALKLMNTDARIPNLYVIASDKERLSIGAWPGLKDSTDNIPLGLVIPQAGWITFNATSIERIPYGRHIYLYDTKTGLSQDLQNNPEYRLYLDTGKYESRFFLTFGHKGSAPPSAGQNGIFNVYYTGGSLYAQISEGPEEKCDVVIANILGQVLMRKQLSGNGKHELGSRFGNGIYFISFYTQHERVTKKILISN